MPHDDGRGAANPVSLEALGGPRGRVVDVVLAIGGPPSHRASLAGACAGLATGALLLAVGLGRPPRVASPPAVVPLEISLDEPAAPPTPPRPPSMRPPAPAASARAPAARAQPRPRPGSVQRQATPAARAPSPEARADELVDLTAAPLLAASAGQDDGAVASAPGATTASGSRRGAPGGPGAGGPAAVAGGPSDQSRPVSLAGESWSCPWPSEAEPLRIDEQAVIIRVVARADGTVEAVTVVTEPGHGFGEAAARCARQARFLPARAPNGQAVRATSPPIVVRFTR